MIAVSRHRRRVQRQSTIKVLVHPGHDVTGRAEQYASARGELGGAQCWPGSSERQPECAPGQIFRQISVRFPATTAYSSRLFCGRNPKLLKAEELLQITGAASDCPGEGEFGHVVGKYAVDAVELGSS